MSLAHLTGERGRDTAIVRGELLAVSPMPAVEARLRAALEATPERALGGVLAGDENSYLEWATELLQRAAAVPFVLIGELSGEDWDRVRILELRTPDGRGDNFEYDLLGTPCSNVVGQTACVYPEQVADLYPADELLAQMDVQSYAGLPLFDPGGRPLGLIALLDQKPWAEGRVPEILALMIALRPRIEEILINRRTRRDMELLSQRLEAGGEADPVGHLALAFAHAMNVKSAFVSSYVDGTRQRMRTVALAVNGRLIEDVEYELAGTPIAEVEAVGEVLLHGELPEAWAELPLVAKAGARSCLVMSLTRRDGRPIGHLGLLHDRPLHGRIGEQPVVRAFRERVTFELRRELHEADRLATERRLLELQRTESLGILVGGIAHDFNNLLVSVLGNSDLALLDLPEDEDEEGRIREYLVDIREAARGAVQLCRQMLAYAGRTKVESRRFELGAEVDALSRLLAASIPRTIEIVVEPAMGEIWVDGDPVQIRQVLMNLITNAGDAIGEAAGRVHVSLGRATSGPGQAAIAGVTGKLPPGSYVCMSVSDDGCGMDEATIKRIFDPFFTTKQAGHGLGLAAMLGVVRGHGGTFRVSSEIGVGTCFTVYLPEAEAGERAPAVDVERAAEPGCVLLVDDNARVRKVARRMLERAQYRVLTAVDGLDALARYERDGDAIDCVVLDLGMPRLGGIETLQRLRERDPEVRVILSSGYSERAALEVVADDEACRVVHKPYEVAQLIGAVSELLESRARVEPDDGPQA